ncbi:hypothetical protein Lnau_0128 [Legionella nautarum]|uniref:Uncharacterized protein n=1 Tax=Legionella nautarum TaxID=45070 RepID=A0A0W0X479_9GAMM|nr:hypothetical protein Lnau_0128 [Legionella nautarum]
MPTYRVFSAVGRDDSRVYNNAEQVAGREDKVSRGDSPDCRPCSFTLPSKARIYTRS